MNAPKRSGYDRGQRVEVKRRGPTGEWTWKGGVVTQVTGRGCYVKLDEGHSNFFWFADMRPEAEPVKAPEPPRMPRPERPVRPLATLGDVMPRSIVATSSAALVAAKPVAVPPPVPVVAPPAATVAKAPRAIHRHDPTPIGNAFRALRLREGVTQDVIAKLLGISNTFWSRIELGGANPSDDLLERFSVLSGQSLDELRALRDGASVTKSAVTPPTSASAEPVAPPLAEPPPVTEPEPQQVEAPPRDGFEAFVDQLDAVVAMPTNRETRRRWFQLARELFDLSREA